MGGTYLGISFVLEMVDFWQRCEPKPVVQDKASALEVEAIALSPDETPVALESNPPTTDVEVINAPEA